MPAFNEVNIKQLNQVEEIVDGDYLIVETENGTNIIDFKNFVVGPNNVSWYSSFVSLSNQVVKSLSAQEVLIPTQVDISSNQSASGTFLSPNCYVWVDTTSSTLTAVLPTGVSRGQSIRFFDVANTFDNNPFTVSRNGHKIQGVAQDMTVTTEGAAFELVYYNSTYGWRIFTV